MQTPSLPPPGAAGFVQANPEMAFALLGTGALLLAALPVVLVRRFVVLPHPSDELLVIGPRRWVRVLVGWAFPALVAGLFAIAVRVALSLAQPAPAGGREWALAVAFALILTLPVAGIAWAIRALFVAGIRATSSGVFIQGSFVRWTDIAGVRMAPSGVVLETPDSALLKRRTLSSLGWALDARAVAELEGLWRVHGPG